MAAWNGPNQEMIVEKEMFLSVDGKQVEMESDD